jgi:hypothetical protein
MISGDRTVEEQWMVPRGGSMLGMSRTVRSGGRSSTSSSCCGRTAIGVTDSTAVFENPEHDFPQRIGYRLVRPDFLSAWIEGTRGGHARRVDFAYRRGSCP